MEPIQIIFPIIALIVGLIAGFLYRKKVAEDKIGTAESYAVKIINDANQEAESQKKKILLETKNEILELKKEHDEEVRQRRSDLQRQEGRLAQKEDNLDKRSIVLDEKSQKLDEELQEVRAKEETIQTLVDEQQEKLESIASLSPDEAKDVILAQVKENTRNEQAAIIREIEQETKNEAGKMAREIISLSIQRFAADTVAETTVSVVSIPNDDMKGRIIGREGRNIRTFETLSGVDLIIDDTPGAVVLSSFDPIRREIARIALERLILDGRIHPTRIEEMLDKAKEDVEEVIEEKGQEAMDETGVHGLHPKLVKLLGRLNYRTSYGQNVLQHSIEVSKIAGMLAEEVGADARLAKRSGLLHDIGKAIDFEQEGTHVELGAQMARRYNESPGVINGILSHHGDVEPNCIESVLVEASDTISAARPGARRESIQNYIQRLENLEAIADEFDGVEDSYAIQAGRELRILINPEKVSDDEMYLVAKEIAERIEEELEYPGKIKVHVIRENRVSEFAK